MIIKYLKLIPILMLTLRYYQIGYKRLYPADMYQEFFKYFVVLLVIWLIELIIQDLKREKRGD